MGVTFLVGFGHQKNIVCDCVGVTYMELVVCEPNIPKSMLGVLSGLVGERRGGAWLCTSCWQAVLDRIVRIDLFVDLVYFSVSHLDSWIFRTFKDAMRCLIHFLL